MMRRRPRKRSQTEGAASHHLAASSVASSPVAAAGPDRLVPTASRRKRRAFSGKLLRSKSAPYGGGDAGTESIRSDEASPAPPRPSVVAPALQSVGGEGRSDVDDGVPSQSAFSDLQRAVKLVADERHLAAHELYCDARRRVEKSRGELGGIQEDGQRAKNKRGGVWWKPEGAGIANATNDASDEEEAWAFLQERKEEFDALENRATLFAAAKENLSIDDDWIHAQTLFGVATSYRREADGSLSVKIEGELHGVPLFEQLVVLRECDLYDTWAPFTSKSKKLAQLDKLDVVAWYIVGVPALGLTRDACYRAVGCDSMREDGSVLLVAVGLNDTEEYGVKDALKEEGGTRQQIIGEAEREELGQQMAVPSESNLFDTTNSSFLARDAILNTLEIPPIPSGMGRGRMTIRNFVASIDILAPTAARTKMVVNVDPNLPLIPQFMIDFCMKRMCGILLSRLQATARKVVRDPVNNQHARRMREDVHFYRDWLLPRFELYCNDLGWQMPPVGAFEVDEEALKAEGTGWIGDSLEPDTHVALARGQLDDDSSCLSPSSMTSDGSRATNFLRKIVRAKSASREEKISSARQRASERLRPNPFSKSKAERLNELKAAKLRAEERRRVRTSSEDSVSSLRTLQTLQVVDLEGEVTRQSLLFGVSFTIHTALLLLRQDALLHLSEWGLPGQEVLDFTLILLQAASLWALLISSVIFAFEEIDFGQRRLVENMGIGRRLFADQVKKTSLLASLSVAIMSCGVGLFVQCICAAGEMERWEWLPVAYLRTNTCKSSNQWSSRALSISSFVTVRVGVFVLSLMLMGKLLLPKPRKRSNDDGRKKDRRSAADIRSSFGSSLNDSQQGCLSSMEVIAEESSSDLPKMVN